MKTPICDFVKQYRDSGAHRLHMPGHKGQALLGPEPLDITEIEGADVLYKAQGIIRQSEDNATALFGSGRTLYSTEGSTLAIRGMLYLCLMYAAQQGRSPWILAGRNAHKSFLTGAALLDIDIRWIYSDQLLCCEITPADLEAQLCALEQKPAAVYVTSPDYLGNMLDIRGLAAVCHRYNVLLLVDNAHGAYLRFLPEDRHPISLGADMCCDSAHKTLPVLTGGAYLHIAKTAPTLLCDLAERAMALFASTSPSYIILQSLDLVNAQLAGDYPVALAQCQALVQQLKEHLRCAGFALVGQEALKITIDAKAYGYTGIQLAACLAEQNMVGEFSDPDYLVLMLTPQSNARVFEQIEKALLSLPKRETMGQEELSWSAPERVLSPRQALLSPRQTLPLQECEGKVLADAAVSCPPAVPILVCGERIDSRSIAIFKYYGYTELDVIKYENQARSH